MSQGLWRVHVPPQLLSFTDGWRKPADGGSGKQKSVSGSRSVTDSDGVSLIGPRGFLYDEIISVDTHFSTSPQLPGGRGLSLQLLPRCCSASELTEVTNI